METIDILNEITEISAFLTQRYNHNSGEELKEYLSTLNSYIARLPALEAEAEFLLLKARGNYSHTEATKTKKGQVSVTLFREMLDSECALQNKVFKFVYRLNKNILEIHKGVITQLSYEKAQAPSRTENDLISKINQMDRQVKSLTYEVRNLSAASPL